MKERPIIFSGPMVRAILAGRKTQTRRIVKPQPNSMGASGWHWNGWRWQDHPGTTLRGPDEECPYGQPGDRLWVRETHAIYGDREQHVIHYRATHQSEGSGWKPSIHMPRWASRITLEIASVRAERLQEISEEDAKSEGARRFDELPSVHPFGQDARWSMGSPSSTDQCLTNARFAFANLWESVNGPSSWDANPWVWVIEFNRAGGDV